MNSKIIEVLKLQQGLINARRVCVFEDIQNMKLDRVSAKVDNLISELESEVKCPTCNDSKQVKLDGNLSTSTPCPKCSKEERTVRHIGKDGVKLYDGDKYFTCRKEIKIGCNTYELLLTDDSVFLSDWVFFATKEACQAYIGSMNNVDYVHPYHISKLKGTKTVVHYNTEDEWLAINRIINTLKSYEDNYGDIYNYVSLLDDTFNRYQKNFYDIDDFAIISTKDFISANTVKSVYVKSNKMNEFEWLAKEEIYLLIENDCKRFVHWDDINTKYYTPSQVREMYQKYLNS